MKYIFFVFLFSLTCFSCRKKDIHNEVSFYFWKTNYHLTRYEVEYLREHQVKKIYLRCFDIVLEGKNPKPEHPLLWKNKPLDEVEYIPTVFIQNKIFSNIDSSFLKNLADKTYRLCKQILASQQRPIYEIQFDCDWTKSTKTAYFYFLSYMKTKKIRVSNTLRLYQYKYRREAGIAPVDYASLMCYNMGNIKDAQAENSILNQKELNSYLSISSYPKPLNVALPIFNWTLLYHGNDFKGILYDVPDVQNGCWLKQTPSTYLCTRDYYDSNSQRIFMNQDRIRQENISKEELFNAQKLIQNKVNNTKHEIIYFDLDSTKLAHCLR